MKIHKLWNGYYYCRGRPSTAELHDELRERTASIRADWELSKPELKHK